MKDMRMSYRIFMFNYRVGMNNQIKLYFVWPPLQWQSKFVFLHFVEVIDCNNTNNSVSKMTACWRYDGISFPGGGTVYF
jgi:hypothetical protein